MYSVVKSIKKEVCVLKKLPAKLVVWVVGGFRYFGVGCNEVFHNQEPILALPAKIAGGRDIRGQLVTVTATLPYSPFPGPASKRLKGVWRGEVGVRVGQNLYSSLAICKLSLEF